MFVKNSDTFSFVSKLLLNYQIITLCYLSFYCVFQIIFPDVNDQNTKQIKKSQVTITGSITGVYAARQQLIVNNFFFF